MSLDVDQASQCISTVSRSLGPSQYFNLLNIQHGGNGSSSAEVYIVHQKTDRGIDWCYKLTPLTDPPNLKEACAIGTSSIINVGDGIHQLLKMLSRSRFYDLLRHHCDTGWCAQFISIPKICGNDNFFKHIFFGDSKTLHKANAGK